LPLLSLDTLDIRIIKELQSPASFQWDPRKSYAALAEILGVDKETVRRRLVRMRKDGFLQGWQLVVNPHLIGREAASVELETVDPEAKGIAIPRIMLVEGVTLIFDFHGKGLQVLLFYESERALARRIQLIASICGGGKAIHWKLGFPPCAVEPRRTDWQIIAAMLRNPRRKFSDTAHEMKVSPRTVKRRMILMANGYAFFLQPVLNSEKFDAMGCRFLIICPDRIKKRLMEEKVLSRFSEIVFSHTAAEEHSLFTIICHNISKAEGIQEWIGGLDGVKEVRMDIVRKMMVVQEWLEEEIEREVLRSR